MAVGVEHVSARRGTSPERSEATQKSGHPNVRASLRRTHILSPGGREYISAPYPRSGVWRIIREVELSEETVRKSAIMRLSARFPRIVV